MDDAEIAAMWASRDLALAMQHAPQPTPTNRVPVRCDHSNNRFDREQGCVVCVRCGVILIPQIFTDAYNNLTFTGDKCGKVSMYKRKHHFNERIAQWTVARERVPDEVVAEVKRRIKGTVTKTAIRAALREMRRRQYIENWIEIYCKITNTPYPAPDTDKLDWMKEIFCQYEVAFTKLKPEYRKAMLNYNYVFMRLLQTANMPEHFKWFPPLKSRVKLRSLDMMYDSMCGYLGIPNRPLPAGRTLR